MTFILLKSIYEYTESNMTSVLIKYEIYSHGLICYIKFKYYSVYCRILKLYIC